MQNQQKTKYQIAQTEQISQILFKYLLKIRWLLQNTTQIAETERNYQITEDKIPKQLMRLEFSKKKLQKRKQIITKFFFENCVWD
jgi:hypothetical protein